MSRQPSLPDRVLDGYATLSKGVALCFYGPGWPLPGLIELRGRDRLEWLQGQATNDVFALDENRPVDFCMCQPTGQILAVCRAWLNDGRLFVATDLERVGAVLRRAREMVVMEEVTALDLTPGYAFVSLQGEGAQEEGRRLLRQLRLDNGSVIALASDRSGRGGLDLWIADEEVASEVVSRFCDVPVETWQIARLEAGIPLLGRDIGERVLPPELGPAFESRYVSYAKGCYVGQEVLHRIHARGHTNRTWSGMLCEAPVEPGDRVSSGCREDAGQVTSAAVSPEFGPIAAAMLRNEVATDGTSIRVLSKVGEIPARVCTLPFRRGG